MQISQSAEEAIDFIPILHKTLKSSDINVKMTCCDAVGWKSQSHFTNHLIASGMDRYIDTFTSHMYSSEPTEPMDSTRPVWLTEAAPGSAFSTVWYANGGSNEGMTWAKKIAVGVVNATLSAYLYWEGLEIEQAKSASHLLDALDGKTVTPSGTYYAFVMWSRFIRPGASRVAVTGAPDSLLTGAFMNPDGSLVVVFTNSGTISQPVTVSLSGFAAGSAAAWVQDNGHNVAPTSVSLSGSSIKVTVPANGVLTVKVTSKSSAGEKAEAIKSVSTIHSVTWKTSFRPTSTHHHYHTSTISQAISVIPTVSNDAVASNEGATCEIYRPHKCRTGEHHPYCH